MPDQQATIFSIAEAVHPILWNSAVKKGATLSQRVTYQLYTLALKFYSVNMQAPHLLVQKAILVLNLPKNLTSSSDESDGVSLAIEVFDSIVGMLKYKLQDLKESSEEYDNHLHALLEIQQFEIRYFSNSGALDLAGEICKICHDFLTELDEKKSSIASAYRACCRLLEASFYLSSNSISSKDSSEMEKKLSNDISVAVDLIQMPAVLHTRTHFSILESLLQLKMHIERIYGLVNTTTYSLPENLEEPVSALFKVTLVVLHKQKFAYMDRVNLTNDKAVLKKLQNTTFRIVDVMTSQLYMESGIIKVRKPKGNLSTNNSSVLRRV
jgi:hypothetical protein